MDALTLFGSVTVVAMLVFYALEERNPVWRLWFAGSCLASSLYGFLQGAWPIGFVELAWTAIALHRWRLVMQARQQLPVAPHSAPPRPFGSD